jgi:hypothetical protein
MNPFDASKLSVVHPESPIQAPACMIGDESPLRGLARRLNGATLDRKRQSCSVHNMDALACVEQFKKSCSGGTKKVKFAANLTTVIPDMRRWSPDFTLMWYGEVDYRLFEILSRLTVLDAQYALLTTGDWCTGLDPTEHCLLGLEHHLLHGQSRQMRVRMHCRRVLSFVKHSKRHLACRHVGLYGIPIQP